MGCQILFDYTDIVDAIKFARQTGFRVLEINLNNPAFLTQIGKKSERERIKRALANEHLNLLIHFFEGLTFFIIDEKMREGVKIALKKSFDWAREIGVKAVTFHLGSDTPFAITGKKVLTSEVFPEIFAQNIKEILLELKSYSRGKTMALIENVGGFRYPFVLKILNEVLGDPETSSGLGLTMDIGHINRLPEDKQKIEKDFFLSHIQFIKNIHIHDNNGEWDEHNIIGNGKIDITGYFKVLAETDAYLIFEVRPKESSVECLRRFEQYIAPKLI